MTGANRRGWSAVRLAVELIVAIVVLNLLFLAIGVCLWSTLIGSVAVSAVAFVAWCWRVRA